MQIRLFRCLQMGEKANLACKSSKHVSKRNELLAVAAIVNAERCRRHMCTKD